MWYGVHRGFQLEDKNDIKHIISTRFSKERQIRHIKRCKMKEDQGGPSLLYISQSQDSRDILPREKGMTVYLDWPRHVLVSIVYSSQEIPIQGFPSPRRQSQRWMYACHRQRSKLHVGSTAPLRVIDSLAIPAHSVEGVIKSLCVP